MKKLTKEDYIEALKKLEKNPSDRVGLLGELGVATTGAVVGALGAGTIASLFGATTILGSSTLAGAAGGILVATTPVGWVIGTAVAGTAAAYGLAKLVKSGGVNYERRQQSILEIKEKIAEFQRSTQTVESNHEIGKLAGSFALLLENNLISQEEVTSIMQGIENGQIDSESAFSIINSLLDELHTNDNNFNNLEDQNLLVRSSFVLLLKHMIGIDSLITNEELKEYENIMENEFQCSSVYAQELFSEAPQIDDIDKALHELKNILDNKQIELLIESLMKVGLSDGEYVESEKALIKKVEEILR